MALNISCKWPFHSGIYIVPLKEISDGVVDAVSVSRLVNDPYINLAASRIELYTVSLYESVLVVSDRKH